MSWDSMAPLSELLLISILSYKHLIDVKNIVIQLSLYY